MGGLAKVGISFNETSWLENSLSLSERLLSNIELLRGWCSWNNIKRQANNKGLGAFVEYITATETKHIIGAFDKAIYKSIINYFIDSVPPLANFNGKPFEDKIREFKELTLQFGQLTRDELFAKMVLGDYYVCIYH